VTLKANADAFAERALPMIADAQRRDHTTLLAIAAERALGRQSAQLQPPADGGDASQ
jgi:hypothetical protein